MGCGTNSKPVKAAPSDRGANPVGVQGAVVVQSKAYKQIINNKSPHIRLDHSAEPVFLPIDGSNYTFDCKYVYVSQRGYYPNSLGKANQDSYLICESFLSDPNTHLFGIFDGHGECGDLCSHFAADQLPVFLEKELKTAGGITALDTPKMESIITKAFVNTNKAMHRSATVDDSLSGTTGVIIILRGDKLIVANVGDSRAIIATDVDGQLKFGALSNDQTPFRKDERERVKKCGARVMTLEQIEGNEPIHENWGEETGEDIDESGDPPRIWDHTLERPGCAFTRSLGDSVAEVCGVFAEPEILTWQLTDSDKFAVVASDGVFEFITSQGVVDMMTKFSNSLDGAKHVVAESYRLWLTYDDRTDDISLIVMDFEKLRLKSNAKAPAPESSRGLDAHHLPAVDSKPVRKVMSKAKRKVISENWDNTDNVEFDFEANASPKTPEQLSRIADMVKANFMFQNLSTVQQQAIFKVMILREVTAGELIIKEGADGDEMYIIDKGEFTVHKKDESGVSQLVFTYTSPGAAFGELSLMYGKPRAASVKAKTNGRLWSIGRQAFRAVLKENKKQGLMDVIKLVPMFKDLTVPQLQRICELSREEVCPKGQVVGSLQAPPDWILCVVLSGKLKLKSTTKEGESSKQKKRSENSYILAIEIETLGVSILSDADGTKLAMIPKDAYDEVLGEYGQKALQDELLSPRGGGGKSRLLMTRQQSMFSKESNLLVKTVHSRSNYVMDSAVIALGDFAYIGTFKKGSGKTNVSLKVIAKKRAAESKMDSKLLQERQYLVALKSMNCPTFINILGIYKDSKVIMIEYEDLIMCDLALAIANNALPSNDAKFHYAAGIYLGLSKIHESGLMHRFINSGSIYVSANGIPKIGDLRYCKKMDGRKAFTICGDPLYFAPEIVSQQGYDFGADLWAFGVLVHEVFEGSTVFGSVDTEETQLFKAITGFKEAINFTSKTPTEAKSLILDLMKKTAKQRIGYASPHDVHNHAAFTGIDWPKYGANKSYAIDLTSTVDPSSVLVESELEDYLSPIFDKF